MDEKYFPEKIEEKWQKHWAEARAYKTGPETNGQSSFQATERGPHPSGFMHMEQARGYSIGDALSWYKRLSSFNATRGSGLVSLDKQSGRLMTQGVVTYLVEGTSEWKRMPESAGNDADPAEMSVIYGADAVRLYLLFAAPPENELRWQETGIEGALRFLRRAYTTAWRWNERLSRVSKEQAGLEASEFSEAARALRRQTHQTIARITADFDELRFNTCVAALMELLNALGAFKAQPSDAAAADAFAVREALEALIVMLAPFAPHIAEELWEALGHQSGLLGGGAVWPTANEELARKVELEIPVQVNGKLRSRLRVAPDISEADLRAAALGDKKVRGATKERLLVKVVVVPRRLVNVVVE